jgi:LPXTG-site transpeptidase (sortase) family protein
VTIRRLLSITLLLAFSLVSSALSSVSAGQGASIKIPALNLSSSIVNFPLVADTWAIDPWQKRVGFLEGTSWFQSPGNMVLAGHSVMPNGKAGIFARIDQLQVGNELIVSDGVQEHHYTVSEVRVVNEYDISVVYPTGDDRLTLITCEASSFDAASQTYSNRVVVVATRSG